MIKKSLVIISGAILLFSIVDNSNRAFGQRGRFGSMGQKTELVKDFDTNGDGWLNIEERNAARRFLSTQQTMEQGGFGGRRFRTSSSVRQVVTPGPKLSPADVKSYAEDVPLYDLKTLRTIFLEFENNDWEAELEAFYQTDVDVPVKMTVDGKTYQNVGVRFRGNGSYIAAGRGQQRPLNLSIDFIDKKQNLYGYETLNLNTSNSITISPDQTYTRQVMFSYIARQYIPTPKANYIRLVINGESWGIYVNYQQFNTDFTQENFGARSGARWKIPVGLGSGNGLNYIGDNVESYKRYYEIKSQDDPNS